MQPAIITFRPENFLTIGLIVGIVYVAAVLAVQGLMRAGLIQGGVPAAGGSPVAVVQN